MLKTVSASAKANVDGMTPRPYSTIHVFGPHSTAVASPGPCTTVSPGGQTGSILMRSPALPCPFHGLCALYVEVKNEKTVSRKEEKKKKHWPRCLIRGGRETKKLPLLTIPWQHYLAHVLSWGRLWRTTPPSYRLIYRSYGHSHPQVSLI